MFDFLIQQHNQRINSKNTHKYLYVSLLCSVLSGCGSSSSEQKTTEDKPIAYKNTNKTVNKRTFNTPLTKAQRQRIAQEYNKKALLGDRSNSIQVTTIITKMQTLPQELTLDGIVTASKSEIILPTVTGRVNKIFFKQGRWIKKNAPLYSITSSPSTNKSEPSNSSNQTSKLALRQAIAQLEFAQAEHLRALAMLVENENLLMQSQNTVMRYEPLIAEQAISEQTYEQALMDVRYNLDRISTTKAFIAQTKADIKASKAKVALYKQQLSDNSNRPIQNASTSITIKAPMTGIVTDSNIKVGQKITNALEVKNLTEQQDNKSINQSLTISDMNPVYVDVMPSSEQYVLLKQIFDTKSSKDNANSDTNTRNQTEQYVEPTVSLILDNKQTYARLGKIAFEQSRVNTDSNLPILRIQYNNDDGLLLAHMKVMVFVATDKKTKVILLPKTSLITMLPNDSSEQVSEELTNNTADLTFSDNQEQKYVFVVNKNNTVTIKPVKTAGTYNTQVKVIAGLKEDERVITDSSQSINSTSVVNVVRRLSK